MNPLDFRKMMHECIKSFGADGIDGIVSMDSPKTIRMSVLGITGMKTGIDLFYGLSEDNQ